jgi:hypothetical protein
MTMALFGRTRKLDNRPRDRTAAQETTALTTPQRQQEIEQTRRDLMLATLEALSNSPNAQTHTAPPEPNETYDHMLLDCDGHGQSSQLVQPQEHHVTPRPQPASMPDGRLHTVMADIVRQDMTRLQQSQTVAHSDAQTDPNPSQQ